MRQGARTFRLYGLTVRTDLPLNVDEVVAHDPDVVISYAAAPRLGAAVDSFTTDWQQSAEGARLAYRYGTDQLEFLLDAGARRMRIRCSRPNLTAEVGSILIGPGMASALHARGARMLHGSAVVVRGGAIVCLGAAGTGKSTLTAAMVAAGAQLLTEDLAVIDEPGGLAMVRSGYPRIGLNPDSLVALGCGLDHPRVNWEASGDDKRGLDARLLAGGFSPEPAPLRAIYALSARRRDVRAVVVEPCPPRHAMPILMSHVYGRHWLPTTPAQVMTWCAELAERVPLYSVALSDRIEDVADAGIEICRRSATGP